MTERKANFVTAADAFEGWREDVHTGSPPVFYPIGSGELARIEIGPKLVTLIGGAPGAGKTAFTMQAVVDALRLTPTLAGAGVQYRNDAGRCSWIGNWRGSRGSTWGRFAIAVSRPNTPTGLTRRLNTLETLAERLAFVKPPFNLENVAASADAFHADLIVLDYIQRIPPPGDHGDKRGSVDATMNYLRQFADAGVAMMVVAAVSRGKDSKGRSTYSGDALDAGQFPRIVRIGVWGRRCVYPGPRRR